MHCQERGAFVRHQISSFPKARQDQVSGLRGGEPKPCTCGSDFCLHELALWISPSRADWSRVETGREGTEAALPVRLPASVGYVWFHPRGDIWRCFTRTSHVHMFKTLRKQKHLHASSCVTERSSVQKWTSGVGAARTHWLHTRLLIKHMPLEKVWNIVPVYHLLRSALFISLF